MKRFSLLKKLVAISSLLCGIIVATNLNAQIFIYNNLKFEVINSDQVSVYGPNFDQNATGNIDIPASVSYNGSNYDVTEIRYKAFNGYSRLTSITIPNSVTTIGNNAFSGCSGLTSITIPNSVTTIRSRVFFDCSGLTSITIPNSVTTIGGYAFGGCSGLTSITIPNSVTTIDSYAFYKCSSLTSITIPNSVTTIRDRCFANCSSLTNITIPNSVTTIEYDAFAFCSSLAAINVDSSNPIYDSRNNCNAIIKTADNELTIGCMNTIIPNSVTTIGGYAFWGCSGLTSITIPNSVTTIGWYAFGGCSGLTSITIPNSVTDIKQDAFLGCVGLTSINVDSSNPIYDSRNNCNAIIKTAENKLIKGCMNTNIPDSLTIIGNNAFWGCSGLTSITIPNSVTTIGNLAFAFCSNLTTVISYSQTPPSLGLDVFADIGTDILFVPQNCVPLYEASDWRNYFTNILEYYESIAEIDINSVSVYPNPIAGKMIVEADNIKNISIFSVSGQLIYETPTTGDTFEYDFGKHGAGVYLVKIETAKGIVTRKVTVK